MFRAQRTSPRLGAQWYCGPNLRHAGQWLPWLILLAVAVHYSWLPLTVTVNVDMDQTALLLLFGLARSRQQEVDRNGSGPQQPGSKNP